MYPSKATEDSTVLEPSYFVLTAAGPVIGSQKPLRTNIMLVLSTQILRKHA